MNKRLLTSLAVAGAFYLAWQFIFQPLFFPAKPPPPPAEAQAGAPVAPSSVKTDALLPPASTAQDRPDVPGLTLESATYRLTLTNKGAGVRELTLKGATAKDDVILLAPHEGVAPHFAVKAEGTSDRIEAIGWDVAEKSDHAVTFRVRLTNGVEIRKSFEVPADGAKPVMKLTLTNVGPEGAKDPAPVTVKLTLLAINGMEHDSEYRYEQYAAGHANTEKGVEPFPLAGVLSGEEKYLASVASKSTEDFNAAIEYLKAKGTHKNWFGAKNRFFALAVAPDDATRSRIEAVWFRGIAARSLPVYKGRKGIEVNAVFDPISLGKDPVVWSFGLFASPLQKASLKELPRGEELMNYGGGCASGCGPLSPLFAPMVVVINVVAPLILGVLAFLASVFGNHGVAIMATTLCIRLCLFPLSRKSQVSMYKMQQLGPKITALRERYKDDQQKFGMEQMRLFREHKINPLSGCLPMLLQMPIFIAMYSVFEMSVELRGRPFLWMELHQPDHLITWTAVNLPMFGPLDAFNLLPIIMTITWFLQSWYAPRSPDPQMAAQQKMMLAMPVVFGLMCYNLASGLSLYFFVNSLLSMTEQKLIKKFFLKPPEDGPKTA